MFELRPKGYARVNQVINWRQGTLRVGNREETAFAETQIPELKDFQSLQFSFQQVFTSLRRNTNKTTCSTKDKMLWLVKK